VLHVLLLTGSLEVEALIESSVEQVLSVSTASLAERVGLVNKLVEALEQDSAWVEMYGMSGELNVPEVFGELGPNDEPLRQVMKVRPHACFPLRCADFV
jgi:hypothetical protein